MKESIWLDRGKRVDELMSLSLEPDITIDESEREIFLKGTLELKGEYRPTDREEELSEKEGGEESLASRALFRSIEEVTLSDEGVGEISHHFPIDITIPKERIDRLEDVDVRINEFDYSFPDSSCLEISADLSILGVRAEEAVMDEAEMHGDVSEQSEQRTFSFEQVRKAHNDKEPTSIETQTYEEDTLNPEFPKYQFNDERGDSFIPESEEETFQEKVNYQKDQEIRSLNESDEEVEEVNVESNEEVNVDMSPPKLHDEERLVQQMELAEMEVEPDPTYEEEEIVEEVKREPNIVFKASKPEQAEGPVGEKYGNPSSEIEDNEVAEVKDNHRSKEPVDSIPEEKAKQEVTNKQVERDEIIEELETGDLEEEEENDNENALYLTKMLSDRKDEAYSKLRMCIVQEGESLDIIAARYKIEVSQIKRMNRLKDEQVSDGEILYIPVRQSSSSK